jgi:hypothetical protein
VCSAIERAGEYRKFLHGEALSLGIIAACAISIKRAGLPLAERNRAFDVSGRVENTNFTRAEARAGLSVVDCVILLREYGLNAGSLKDLSAPTVRFDFNQRHRAGHSRLTCIVLVHQLVRIGFATPSQSFSSSRRRSDL